MLMLVKDHKHGTMKKEKPEDRSMGLGTSATTNLHLDLIDIIWIMIYLRAEHVQICFLIMHVKMAMS